MTTTMGHHRSSTRLATLAATRPLARAALSCGVATALAVGAAGAAGAASRPDVARQDRPAEAAAAKDRGTQGEGQGPEKATAGQRDGRAADREEPTADGREQAREAKPASSSQRPSDAAGSERSRSAEHSTGSSSSRGTAAEPQRSQDPAGNNGTVKVDGAAYDTRVDNEPHVSCAFRVTFFGFDEGQTADITVTGVAPTRGGLLLQEKAVPTSGDRAGGAANDTDGATRVYTADDLGLTGVVAPHPKQGYHIKVAVDSLEAPGGAKQKVLWLEPCAAAEEAPTQGSEELPPVRGEAPFNETPERPAVVQAPQPEAAPSVSQGALTESPAAAVRPALASSVAAEVAATSAPQQASALPRALAWTGAAGLALMALLGAGTATTGAALQVARRRLGSSAQ